ncbi:hypothetical protein MKZ20_21775 [Psychrobacillus sp. FSL K6-2684]|uniref:hypothetical protein n=1 Tax=unclassified Psychrobacillus TaxID=2636677 RepID=UPI0030F9524C
MQPYYRVTCFMEKEPSEIFPLLLPLHFKWAERESIVWEKNGIRLQIIPFSSKGSDSMGYRILYHGNPDTFVKLMDHFLGGFTPFFSGIEWINQTKNSQESLVKLAEEERYERCSMYGLYEHKGVGIVLMPSGEVNLQVRNRKINSFNLSKLMYCIESVAAAFQPKAVDLFSFLEKEQEVYYA